MRTVFRLRPVLAAMSDMDRWMWAPYSSTGPSDFGGGNALGGAANASPLMAVIAKTRASRFMAPIPKRGGASRYVPFGGRRGTGRVGCIVMVEPIGECGRGTGKACATCRGACPWLSLTSRLLEPAFSGHFQAPALDFL